MSAEGAKIKIHKLALTEFYWLNFVNKMIDFDANYCEVYGLMG